MTNEQLNEIEKLAEADMSEPWSEAESAYVMALQRYALPLVKALREARAISKGRREEAFDWISAYFEAKRERDEARAERDKYKSALDAELPAAWREDIESLNSCLERIGKERDEARAEVERLKVERDEARKWLEGICSEFEATIAHAEWRAAGSKGMSVTFTGDFASVVQLPGAINKMRWWVKVFRAVLKGEQP